VRKHNGEIKKVEDENFCKYKMQKKKPLSRFSFLPLAIVFNI